VGTLLRSRIRESFVVVCVVAGFIATAAPVVAADRPAHPSGTPGTTDLGSRRGSGGRSGTGSTTTSLGTEIAPLRTATSNTYVDAHGLHTTRIYAQPVNFEDGHGNWQQIDNTLVRHGSSLSNAANRYKLTLPATLSTPIHVAMGSSALSFQLQGAAGKAAAVADSTASYAEVLPATSVAYSAENQALKETVSLGDRAAPHTLTYLIRGSAGLSAKLTDAGAVRFSSATGATIFTFTAPYMWDAKGVTSHAITTTLRRTADGWTLTEHLSSAWLHAAARAYPVTVDPTLEFIGADQDCTISGGASAATSLCSTKSLDVGYDGSKPSRALLQFNIGSYIPADSQVLNARLGLYLTGASTAASTTVGVYRLTQSWTMSASWNRFDGTNAWGSPGGDYDSSAADTQTVGTTAGWKYFYPTQLVQDWVKNKQPNDGFIVRQQGEATNQVLHFGATTVVPGQGLGHTRGEGCCVNGTSPFLDVAYEERLGTERFYTLESQTLYDRMNESVNVAGGNLVLHNADLHITGTGLNLGVDRYYNNQSLDTLEFGGGWNMSTGADVQLIPFDDGTVAFYDPSGGAWRFTKATGGGYTTPSGLDAKLTRNDDGTYELKDNASQTKWSFGSDGYPTKEQDRNDNAITFAYTTVVGVKSISSITDTQGRVTNFAYNSAGYISTMTDSTGRQWQYFYDKYGDLATVLDPNGGRTDYYYDAAADLTEIIDPDGKYTLFTYDSQYRVASVIRVTNTKAVTGPTTTFTYNADNTVVTDPNGHKTTYKYDPDDRQGKVTKVTDANGNETSKSYTSDANVEMYASAGSPTTPRTFTYDSTNNVLTDVKAPTGAATHLDYGTDQPFEPSKLTNPQGKTTNYSYDGNGNLSKVVSDPSSPGQVTLSMDHNGMGTGGCSNSGDTGPKGTVRCVKDGDGNETYYHYDVKGNLTSVNPATPLQPITLTYDALSRVATIKDGAARSRSYTYDKLDRVTKVTYGDGTSVSYAYDVDGNRTSRTSGLGTTTYGYDQLNRLTSTTLPGPKTLTYGYDAASNLTAFVDASGTTTYTYTSVNEVATATEPDGAQTIFGYDKDYNRTSVTYPNHVAISNSYDSSDRLTDISDKGPGGNTLRSLSYSYKNPAGGDSDLRWSVTDNVSNAKTTYDYDALERLTSASTAGGDSYSYAYDLAGNITSRTQNGSTTTYTPNSANELKSTGSTTYSYDGAGNLTGASDGSSFAYNAASQTSSMTPAGGSPSSFGYGDAGQADRTSAGGTSFVNAALGVTSESSSAGTTYYTRDGKGYLLGERTQAGTYYYLQDGLGSIIALTDSAGNVAASYSYDPYGRTASSSGSVTNPWRYAGQYLDTSTGMYHMGERYYDPRLGRWTQQDRISHPADLQQANRYVYAGDDPVNAIDPMGTDVFDDVGDFVSDNYDQVTEALKGYYDKTIADLQCEVAVGLGTTAGFIAGSEVPVVGNATGAYIGAVSGLTFCAASATNDLGGYARGGV
jgi:RHS repeat-associated protein